MALQEVREDLPVTPHELTLEEGRAAFARAARKNLGISGEEFKRRWNAGECDVEDPRVVRVAMLMSLDR